MAGGMDHEGHPYHFKVLGFPVHVGWQFFLIAFLLSSHASLGGTLAWIVIDFLAVLVHELGHALAFRAFGSHAWIRLWGMGGLTYGRPPRHRWQDVVVSLAGPVPPLLLIGVPALIAHKAGVADGNLFWRRVLLDIWWANLVWSVVNLLPILPMDGGRLADTLFGRGVARVLSVLSGLAVAAGAFALGSIYLGVLGLAVAGYNIYAFAREQRAGVEMRSIRRVFTPPRSERAAAPADTPDAAWQALDRGDVAGAAGVVSRLGAAAPNLLAGAVLAAQGRPDEALAWYVTGLVVDEAAPPTADRVLVGTGLALPLAQALGRTGDAQGEAALARLHLRLRSRGHAAVAGEVGQAVAGRTGDGRDWYEVARTWAQAGDPDRAVAALQESARRGHATATTVAADPAFSRLFAHDSFARVAAQLGP